ncbi:MAG: histidine phosphatase family protein [Chloroflexota bacterium]
MKNLLILRHAKSSWANMYMSDFERPLNPRGQGDAPRMGQLLKDEGLVPDQIISSSANRALTTAELVALAADFVGDFQSTRRFYLADPETYIDYVRAEGNDNHQTVMVVGHNPGMEDLVTELTGWTGRFTTANLAHVVLPIDSWRDLRWGISGELKRLWRPKELRR